MFIEKNQTNVDNFRNPMCDYDRRALAMMNYIFEFFMDEERRADVFPVFNYDSARSAMKDLFTVLMKEKIIKSLFLPAYIGVSPKEGSGIYDPVCELEKQGLSVFFYKMTENLDIDIESATSLIDKHGNEPFIFLRVNYFGFVDKNADYLYRLVQERGGLTITDNAHGYFTYFRHKKTLEDATFFSLHKQFPFQDGGMLRIVNNDLRTLPYSGWTVPKQNRNQWLYDSAGISEKRRNNYKYLLKASEDYKDIFIPLKSLDNEYEVPQTFPIKLLNTDRFKVYLEMNEKGYGVVSLYHTLIEPLKDGSYPTSEALAECILNLPVHQDVEPEKYPEMLSLLAEVCRKYRVL